MTYAYVRVSTVEQKIDRQLDSLAKYKIDEIFTDKQSGKNFNRDAYQKMKKTIQKGDLLILHSIDRLGRNYTQILEEWRDITQDIGCHVLVLDMPLLDTRGTNGNDVTGKLLCDIVLQILAYVAQKERENMMTRQREGIQSAIARGTYHPGRPRLKTPGFDTCYESVKAGEMQVKQALKKLGISRSSWYNLVRQKESDSASNPCFTTNL